MSFMSCSQAIYGRDAILKIFCLHFTDSEINIDEHLEQAENDEIIFQGEFILEEDLNTGETILYTIITI